MASNSGDSAKEMEVPARPAQRPELEKQAVVNEGPAHLGVGTVTSDHVDEKKILRKMDTRLIPILTLLYLLSFLDRGNIGNAEVEGLSKSLNIAPDQYNWCLTVFFFTYAAFEVPSNLLLKKLRPSRWLPAIMVAWGLVLTLMGLVRNYRGLLIARFFLGVAEAGLYPGIAFYLTTWYCRQEIQFRQALFFSAASVAGAFSGLLAFAISKMDGAAGLEGWRWIFILEGIATVLVACSARFLIHDCPDTASFLTGEERAFVVHRLLKDQGGSRDADADAEGQQRAESQAEQEDEFAWKYVWQAFGDWQVWVNIVMIWGATCPLYGISLFLPTIIKSLGYSKTEAQLMTVPIYITAAFLAVIVAFYSDKIGKRSPFLIGLMCLELVGFTMCIASSNPRVVYAGVFIATCALYPVCPGVVTWLSNNLSGSYKRSAGMALQLGVGNFGGAMASNFYRKEDAPRYVLGHALELGFITMGIVAGLVLVLGYRRINGARERALARGEARQFTRAELSAQGDKAITFRYMY
ncbi:hypothetical protein E4U41_005685 [Claviceps citrina]|nr:hypothetical protein E4U41_005685 [Claviceps citrina]